MTVSLGRRRTLAGVLAATVVALLARFYALGWRVFHWDEGRYGYWILRYMETGAWEYRPIVHGPFLFHVNKYVFQVVEPTDFAARAVVALVGGLLPLVAWWFRDRLGDVEVVAFAAFLAVNPILLYYSRFMRNDVLVGGFALVAFAAFLRAHDTGRPAYLYGGALSLALAFTAKENAVLYVVCWLGALAFLLDNRLVSARHRDEDWLAELVGIVRGTASGLRPWLPHVAGAFVLWFVVVVFFYAPRPELYQPSKFGYVLHEATVGAGKKLFGQWVSGGLQDHSYVAFLKYAVEDAVAVSLPVFVFGVGGFLVDRYSRRKPRDLVAFTAFWGVASFLGYPAVTDLAADWSLVHAVIPMALPAAVGVRLVVERGVAGLRSDDRVSVALAAVVLLAVAGQVGVAAVETSYVAPQSNTNPLVQYGQPAGHIQEKLDQVMRIAREHDDGEDVLFVGEHYDVPNETDARRPVGVPGDWFHRLPLPWYLERANAEVDSTRAAATVNASSAPPVVVARAKHHQTLQPRLSGYDAYVFEITSTNTETIIYVDKDWM